MTFTYQEELDTDLERVRFYVRDVVSGSGPRPDDDHSNFSDEELLGLVTTEGSWQSAVAACYEALAGEWAQYVDTQVGPRREMYSQAAERYQYLGRDWRRKVGATGITGGAGTVFPTPVDGYSDDIRTDE